MLRNYFTIALRNLYKHWVYSILNIVGLAVGISFFTLLFIIINYEVSYDKIHTKNNDIYRVIEKIEQNGVGEESASLPFLFSPTIKKEFPEYIKSTTRIFNFQLSSHSISYGDIRENERKFYFADTSFFHVFDYPLLKGDKNKVLKNPNSVVISLRIAKKYFGEKNPIGETIYYEDNIPLTVTGVLTEKTYPSHFDFDFLASLSSVDAFIHPMMYTSWVWNPCWTYITLKEDVLPIEVNALFPLVIEKYFPPKLARNVDIYLQNITEIHLNSHLDYELSENGEQTHIFIFGVIASLILIITIINFTNLSTARYSMRAKEIGIRKAIGADKSELIQQFLVESIFISMIGIISAFVLIEVLLPYVADLTNKDLTYNKINKASLVASLFGSGLIVGFLSSIYPSYYLSKFLPAEVMNGEPVTGMKSSKFRSILVILQFCITIYLLISTMVSFSQIRYMRNAETGFSKERIIMIPLPNTSVRMQLDKIKSSLLKGPEIKSVTVTEEVLGATHQTHPFTFSKYTTQEEDNEDEMIFLPSMIVDHDFIKTFDIQLLVGRSFDKDSLDEKRGVIVNNELVRFMEWGSPEEALGKSLYSNYGEEKVIGVVENFNFESLREKVTPFVLDLPNSEAAKISFYKYIAIKIEGRDYHESLGYIESTWKKYIPNRSFEYFFLDKRLTKLYLSELKLGRISANFSLVAIFIACLGLFGLSSFIVEQKRKEIAIRKAIGTTNSSIIFLLSNEFLALVGISLLIAWPFSYFMMNSWLNRFPFHINISFEPFLSSGLIVIFITLITVSYHTVKAAMKNPIDDLKRE